MSEGLHDEQEPILPVNQDSSTGEPEGMSSEGNSGDELQTSDPVIHGGDSGRWDKQKAMTMAAVLSHSGETDDGGSILNDELDYRSSRLARLKERYDKKRGDSEDENRELDKRLESDRNYVNESLNERIDQSLSPFEEFYDSNPDKYAEMKTSDFMALAKTFEGVTNTIGYYNEGLSGLMADVELIQESLQGFTALDRVWALGVSNDLGYLAKGLDEEFDSSTFWPDSKALFDMSPRQLLESQHRIIGSFTEKVQAKIRDLEVKRDEILGKDSREAETN